MRASDETSQYTRQVGFDKTEQQWVGLNDKLCSAWNASEDLDLHQDAWLGIEKKKHACIERSKPLWVLIFASVDFYKLVKRPGKPLHWT